MRFIFLTLLACPELYASVELAQKRLNLESSINNQLRSELKHFLPPGTFVVMTSVDLDVSRIREVKEGELIKGRGAPNAMGNDELPGFEGEDRAAIKPGQERTIFHMVDRERLNKIAVRVVFDESLATDRIEMAQALIVDRMRASFGSIARAEFQTASIKAPAPAGIGGHNFFESLKEYWWIAILLFAVLTIALALGTALIRRLLLRKPNTVDPDVIDVEPLPQQAPGQFHQVLPGIPAQALPGSGTIAALPAAQNIVGASAAPLTTESCIEELFREIAEDPLAAFNFLSYLDEKRKTILGSCFQDSPLKSGLSAFIGEMDQMQPDISNIKDDEKLAFLASIYRELQQYKRLLKIQLQQKMGFVHFLQPKDLIRLIDGRDLSYVRAVLKYLPQEKLAAIVGALPKAQRQELLRRDHAELTEEQVNAIEAELRQDVERISQELLRPEANHDRLTETIIEQSSEDTDFLEEIFATDDDYRKKYKHFLATFEDFVVEQDSVISATIENLPNETVALTILDLPPEIRERFLQSIPDLRRDVVKALLVSLRPQDKKLDVETARQSMVGAYRQYVRSKEGSLT